MSSTFLCVYRAESKCKSEFQKELRSKERPLWVEESVNWNILSYIEIVNVALTWGVAEAQEHSTVGRRSPQRHTLNL